MLQVPKTSGQGARRGWSFWQDRRSADRHVRRQVFSGLRHNTRAAAISRQRDPYPWSCDPEQVIVSARTLSAEAARVPGSDELQDASSSAVYPLKILLCRQISAGAHNIPVGRTRSIHASTWRLFQARFLQECFTSRSSGWYVNFHSRPEVKMFNIENRMKGRKSITCSQYFSALPSGFRPSDRNARRSPISDNGALRSGSAEDRPALLG